MTKLLISEFVYVPRTRKFSRYGTEWKAAGIDAAVGTVHGMKASQWLKLYGERG
jgi:hypothetical protein